MKLLGAFQKPVFLSPELLSESRSLLVTPAALTTSMFVSVCMTLDGVRGSSSASHDTCSSGFTCKMSVSMSCSLCTWRTSLLGRAWWTEHGATFVAESIDGLTSLQNPLLPRPDS
ncbi:hypothetical protein BDR06DRAFT_956829 [Suillus hirtellus]|nr:hypothetical protein BDR06DRAFT_956829 [Suillus hirtellus]